LQNRKDSSIEEIVNFPLLIGSSFICYFSERTGVSLPNNLGCGEAALSLLRSDVCFLCSVQFSSVQFSSVQFSSVQFCACGAKSALSLDRPIQYDLDHGAGFQNQRVSAADQSCQCGPRSAPGGPSRGALGGSSDSSTINDADGCSGPGAL